MINFINYRMRVTLSDGRVLVGQFLAFDKVRPPFRSGGLCQSRFAADTARIRQSFRPCGST